MHLTTGQSRSALLTAANRLPLLIFLIALPLAALTPLVASGIVDTHDGLYHIFRAVQLDLLLRDGWLYPRWAPDMAHGYGYPLFNFYSPAVSYLLVFVHTLGFPLPTSYEILTGLSLFVAGAGMFYLARGIFGIAGALVASTCYVYSPYLLANAYVRGDSAELLALGLVPWLLVVLRRLPCDNSALLVVAAGVAFGGLVVTHNLSAMLFSPLLGAVGISMVFGGGQRRAGLAKLAIAIGLGIGLSAFYWLPVVVEREWIQLERVVMPPAYDVHSHFVSLDAMLAPLQGLDVRDGTAGLPPWHLEIVQATMACLGIAWLAIRRTSWHFLSLLGPIAVLAVFYVFMVTSASSAIWDAMPLVGFVQFPWRLMGMVSLGAAIFAGFFASAVVGSIGDRWPNAWPHARYFSTGLLMVAVALPSLFYLYPANHDLVADVLTMRESLAYEDASQAIGTTTMGEYLPKWVGWLPDGAGEPLAERIDRGVFDPEAGVDAQLVDSYSGYEAYIVTARKSMALLFRQLFYPGWHAYVDGTATAVKPAELHNLGWVTFDLPPGKHFVEVKWEDTAAAMVGNGVSLAAVVVTLIGAVVSLTAQRRRAKIGRSSRTEWESTGSWLLVGSMFVLALLVAKLWYFDGADGAFWRRSPPGQVSGAGSPLVVNFGGEMMSVAYDLPTRDVRPGQSIDVTIFWEAIQSPRGNFASVVELTPSTWNGPSIARSEGLFGVIRSTPRWSLGKYYPDRHRLSVPPGTLSGEYTIKFGLVNLDKGGAPVEVTGSQPPQYLWTLDGLRVVE